MLIKVCFSSGPKKSNSKKINVKNAAQIINLIGKYEIFRACLTNSFEINYSITHVN
jgi:hypothetical protein